YLGPGLLSSRFMENCAGCGKPIHRDEPVSASFSQEGQRSFFHKTCEDRAEHVNKWKEEAAWAFRATRLTMSEWDECSPRKHLGVWQSIFIARRDEDVWCPDCGLKIARQETLTCPTCGGRVIITDAETTKMVFTHRQALYRFGLAIGKDGASHWRLRPPSSWTP